MTCPKCGGVVISSEYRLGTAANIFYNETDHARRTCESCGWVWRDYLSPTVQEKPITGPRGKEA